MIVILHDGTDAGERPLLWLVGFLQPSTVIVMASLIKERPPPTPRKE